MQPREKLAQLGAAALDDEELLAVLLRTGPRGTPVRQFASELLQRMGGFRGLFQAEQGALLAIPGIGPAKSCELAAVVELTRRYLKSGLRRDEVFTDSTSVRSYLRLNLRHRQQEVFACLFLDNQHRLIQYEELFFGTIDGASVHPREVVRRAIHLNAAAVIFAHNHPSGVAEPSQADQRITERLLSALALIDVRVLDHLIVGDPEVVSLAELGLLASR